MSANDFALVRGLPDTRLALRRWKRAGWRVLGQWLGLSALIAAGLLLGILAIATVAQPDLTRFRLAGLHTPAGAADYLDVLFRNSLVLALHAMACVAGFIAGSSLPQSAAERSGLDRWVHEKAGWLAIAFVVGATAFSLITQAFSIGAGASTLASQLGLSPGLLLLGLLPHALPELVALFLPLGAWLVASRRGSWHELLAATLVTVAVAIPVLLVSAAIELWVSPELLRLLASG